MAEWGLCPERPDLPLESAGEASPPRINAPSSKSFWNHLCQKAKAVQAADSESDGSAHLPSRMARAESQGARLLPVGAGGAHSKPTPEDGHEVARRLTECKQEMAKTEPTVEHGAGPEPLECGATGPQFTSARPEPGTHAEGMRKCKTCPSVLRPPKVTRVMESPSSLASPPNVSLSVLTAPACWSCPSPPVPGKDTGHSRSPPSHDARPPPTPQR